MLYGAEFLNRNSISFLEADASDDLDDADFKAVIKSREARKKPFSHSSKQLNHRTILVEHLQEVANNFQSTHASLHLAIYLLDIYMDNHDVDVDKFVSISDACMSLSLKLEENVQSSKKTNIPNEHLSCEMLILKFFDWYIMFPTAAHFLYYYADKAVTEEEMNFLISLSGMDKKTIETQLYGQLSNILNKIINDVHYNCYKSSLVAAAAIAAARKQIGLPSWNIQLQILTNYSSEDISGIKQALLKASCLLCTKCTCSN